MLFQEQRTDLLSNLIDILGMLKLPLAVAFFEPNKEKSGGKGSH